MLSPAAAPTVVMSAPTGAHLCCVHALHTEQALQVGMLLRVDDCHRLDLEGSVTGHILDHQLALLLVPAVAALWQDLACRDQAGVGATRQRQARVNR